MKTMEENSKYQVKNIMPGKVMKITFYHDDDCPFFSGWACTCEPEIRITALEPKDLR